MEGPAAAELSTGARRTGVAAAAVAVLARPRLWPAAWRQLRALVPSGWWRRAPFLPVPSRDWLRFRLATAYGDPSAPLDVDDLLVWLAWTDTVRPTAFGSAPSEPRPAPGTPARRRGRRG